MTSILTNNSAMTALKVLRQTESALGTTQERISTGLKVNSAKDDASTWAIAQGIKSDVAAFKTMGEGLTMAGSAIKVAAESATSINAEITTIKQKIAQAKQPGADRTAIQAQIDSSLQNIQNITANASFNGTNLINNNNTLKVLASTSRDAAGAAQANYIDVAGVDLNVKNGGGLSALDGLKVTRDAVVTGTTAPATHFSLDDATAAGTVTLNYQTASGQAKAVTLNVANGATGHEIAKNMLDTFGDQLEADGLKVEYNNAGTPFGNLEITSTKPGARMISMDAPTLGAMTGQGNYVNMIMADATLNDGDEFRFSVNMGGTVLTTVLRVGSQTAVLGKDADGNTLVGLNKAALTDGAAIATELQNALGLVTWDHDANTGTAEVALFSTIYVPGQNFALVPYTNPAQFGIQGMGAAGFITDVTLPDADFADMLDRVEQAQKVATSAAQAFGTAQSQAESQKDFLKNLVDSLETGVGALVDADITAESARLNALQTQQQLAVQSLSIANQGSQLVLSLFR